MSRGCFWSVFHNLAAFMRLRSDERHLLLGALALLPLAQIAAHLLPLPKLIRLFDLRTTAPASQSGGLADLPEHLAAATAMRKIFRVIERKFYFWPGKCLAQALVARFFLRRRGVACLLILGAKQSTDEAGQLLRAHAWLKAGDIIITGDGVTDYIPVVFFI